MRKLLYLPYRNMRSTSEILITKRRTLVISKAPVWEIIPTCSVVQLALTSFSLRDWNCSKTSGSWIGRIGGSDQKLGIVVDQKLGIIVGQEMCWSTRSSLHIQLVILREWYLAVIPLWVCLQPAGPAKAFPSIQGFPILVEHFFPSSKYKSGIRQCLLQISTFEWYRSPDSPRNPSLVDHHAWNQSQKVCTRMRT